MREGFIETANGRIWYSVQGESGRKSPILVLHGGPGFLSMTEGLEPLWQDRSVIFYDQLAFPNARLAVLPQASHLHQIEQPEIFAAVVKAFLRDLELTQY